MFWYLMSGLRIIVPSMKALITGSVSSSFSLDHGAQQLVESRMSCILMTNRSAKIVHPIAIPICKSIQPVVNVEVVKLNEKLAKYFF